jgi:hypothetical protein
MHKKIIWYYDIVILLCILYSVFYILYYLCITVYILFIVTLPPGISPIAVGNIRENVHLMLANYCKTGNHTAAISE